MLRLKPKAKLVCFVYDKRDGVIPAALLFHARVESAALFLLFPLVMYLCIGTALELSYKS